MAENYGFNLVTVPAKNPREADSLLQTFKAEATKDRLVERSNLVAKFDIPTDLLVGTLNQLMSVSDTLSKLDHTTKSVLKQVERNLFESHERVYGKDDKKVDINTINDRSPEEYMMRFKWDDAKYPLQRPLGETAAQIKQNLSRIEEGLKLRLAEFHDLKQKTNQSERKKGGSLISVDLNEIVSKANEARCNDDGVYVQLRQRHKELSRGGGGGESKGNHDPQIARVKQEMSTRSQSICMGADEFVNTSSLVTCMVIVGKAQEPDFLKRYSSLAGESVPLGVVSDAEWRSATDGVDAMSEQLSSTKIHHEVEMLMTQAVMAEKNADNKIAEAKIAEASQRLDCGIRSSDSVADIGQDLEQKRGAIRGSPAVPETAFKVHSDKDNCIYAVIVLRAFVDEYTSACKKERWTCRPFEYDPAGLEVKAQKASQVEFEYNKASSGIYRFCATAYADAFKAFVHTKCLRAYAESILRYGPPTQLEDGTQHNFCALLVKPSKGKELRLRDYFTKKYASLFQDEADMRSDDLEAFPYVFLEL